MKRLAGYTAVVIATLAILVLLWQFRAVVGVFVLSLLVTAAVRPVIARLVKLGLPLSVAMLLIYATGLILLGLLLYGISGSLLEEIQTLANNTAVMYELSYPRWQEGTPFQQSIAARLPPPDQLYDVATGQGQQVVQAIFGVTRSFFSVIGTLLLALLLSIYWSADQDRFERLWLSLLPAARRAQARSIWRAIESGVGTFLGNEAVQVFLAAVLLVAGYSVLGLNYPTILGLTGALAWLVPLVGSVFITVLAFLVGLSTDLEVAVGVALYTIVVLAFLKYVIEPRIFNYQRYSSLLAIVTMIPLADAFGIIGLIVAPALAAAIQILFSQLLVTNGSQIQMQSEEPITQLQERLHHVRATFEEEAELPPEVASLLERLSQLIERASEVQRLKKRETPAPDPAKVRWKLRS